MAPGAGSGAFEEIKPGARLRGLDPAGIAEVVSVSQFGGDAINLVFRVDGKVAERLVYRGEETSFEFVSAGIAATGRYSCRPGRLSVLSTFGRAAKCRAYLPKLRDRVVLETSIKDAVAKLDPQFGYADGFDEASGKYHGLIWAKDPPQPFPATAMLVSDAAVKKQLAEKAAAGQPPPAGSPAAPGASPDTTDNKPVPAQPSKVRRFYGSVELDMVRPVKAFDAVLNAIVMELQRDAYKHAQGWRGGLDASGELRCAQGGQSICDAREAAYPRERARCRSPLLIICAGLRHG